ncbi:hypothetical protein A2cp1_3425 [Anaeromyxobacter dehalogenans 2CP-1]|uniref:Uncharacterized protein n=1 Tax=Anaeromyxobacter dehalogenans (strain ATCC BAA-258 / DSM 21875 / 2CP-1) TaxID=455488 RepID=B8JHP3_ANAD2|nr:hypothetical protein [Anaeromyxobacter dehalogenans]ACL66755.1 hypothetical protein A2cp1_3425 [Anaeromyxobacter dehalogenans 2CP-1]
MSRSREELQREAEAEFAAIEEAAAREAGPGVMDVLSLYGGYERAVVEVGRYLVAEAIAPMYSTNDGSER